ncbi:MAG: SUMF1/EgtB/PvdO family nonheme iron enzyme, partial [Alistipes sp.]|nr:SUMF1/EgtB/PvdO family nonheme iron enzyme [Alistipes sp.]
YSGSYNVDEVAWYCDNAENMTHPVGQKKPNPRGIYDMSGNVFELCYDWFGMYSTAHQTNPIGPSSGTFRIMRGGSYVDNAFGCRIIYRNGLDSQDTRYINVGLRLAMSADSTGPDYNDRGDWLGPDFYNPINPNPDPDNPNPNPDDPDPDNPNPNPDDPDPDNPNPTPNPDNPNPDNPDDDTPGGGGGGVTTYYVGKLVTVNGVQGIVYQTSPCVKIVTVKETTAIWCEFIDYEKTGATDADDGAKNMAVLKALGLNKYPAAKWCADLGEGWYLPAKNELVDIYDKKEWINDILLSNGFDELGPKEGNSAGSVWSSTEYSSHYAYRMYFSNSFMGNYDKQYKCGVRAVRVMK